MDAPTTSIVIVIVAALFGVVFSVAPIVPGTLALPFGAIAIGLIDGFGLFAWWFWVLQAVLVLTYIAVDNVAQALGVQRAGGSRQAMIGGAVGVIAGPIVLAPVLNFAALLVGPPIGAVTGTIIGEHRARRAPVDLGSGEVQAGGYARLGWVALVAFGASILAKLVVVSVQIGLLAAVAL